MEDDPDYHIELHCRSDRVPISEETIHRAVRAALSSNACRHASVSVAIVDDDDIARLNKSYLGHSGPTDVLSFNLADTSADGAIDGEVVVSAETAAGLAALRNLDPQAELLLYVIHGTLHLLGFDDADAQDAAVMHDKEDALLVELGYDSVYRKGQQ